MFAARVVAAAVEPFGGDRVIDNTVRLTIIIAGITLALVCGRLAVRAAARRDRTRFCAAMSAGLIVATPAVSGILRFGQPLAVASTVLYLAGLLFGVVAAADHLTINPPWRRKPPTPQGAPRARRRR